MYVEAVASQSSVVCVETQFISCRWYKHKLKLKLVPVHGIPHFLFSTQQFSLDVNCRTHQFTVYTMCKEKGVTIFFASNFAEIMPTDFQKSFTAATQQGKGTRRSFKLLR